MVLFSLEGLCCLVNFLHIALYTLQVPSDNTLLHSISTRTRTTRVDNRDLYYPMRSWFLWKDYAVLLAFYTLYTFSCEFFVVDNQFCCCGHNELLCMWWRDLWIRNKLFKVVSSLKRNHFCLLWHWLKTKKMLRENVQNKKFAWRRTVVTLYSFGPLDKTVTLR